MMDTLILYATKQLVCGAVLFGYYYAFLRNHRFHQWNRFYLLATVLLCMVVPFINIPLNAEQLPLSYELAYYTWPANSSVKSSVAFNAQSILALLYALGCLVMLCVLVSGLVVVHRMRRNKTVIDLQHAKLVVVQDRRAPFSFFKWLYWRADLSIHSADGQRMLKHELAHITQQHSADKLFMETCLLFCWFNPFLWLTKKELNAIHEFLADKRAVADGDSAAFASMILAAALPQQSLPLTSPLISSQLKRRLHMITNSSKSSYAYARRIAGLVIILFTAGILTVQVQKANAQVSRQHHATPKAESLPDSIRSMQIWDNKGECYVTYQMKDGRRIVMKLNDTEARGYPIPPPPPEAPAPPPAPPAPAKAKKATPSAPTSAPTPPAAPTAPTPPAAPKAPKQKTTDITAVAPAEEVVYYLNGALSSAAEVHAIDPNNIESVHVLKGEQAAARLGRNDGSGVVEVFTKGTGLIASPAVKISPIVAKKQLNWKAGERPLFIINNKEATEEEFRTLPENAIGEIEVLKGVEATRRYGPKALHGVVIVRPGC